MLNQSQICNTAVLVLLCYKIWIRSSPDQSWQAFQTGYRLREAMSPKLDLAGIPERRDTVVVARWQKSTPLQFSFLSQKQVSLPLHFYIDMQTDYKLC